MARTFVVASSQYLEYATAIVTAYPFTMAAWFNSTSVAVDQSIMSLADAAGTGEIWHLTARGTVGGDPVQFTSRAGGVNSVAGTAAGFSANTWHHACGVGASATDRTVYIDGGNPGTNVTSSTPSGLDATTIGRISSSSPTFYFGGRIAEAAIWNVALDAAEVAALAKGFSPRLIRPASLLAYWPLIGNYDPEIDLRAGQALTVTGATVGDHPRIIQARRRESFWVQPAAAGGLARFIGGGFGPLNIG